MVSHSLSGYLALLIVRQTRTLLVEGPSDAEFAARIVLHLERDGALRTSDLVIDSADTIRSEGRAEGNRDLVELIHSEARSPRLAALVDREFRDTEFDPSPKDLAQKHVVRAGSVFWSRGHSIENYLFTHSNTDAVLSCFWAAHYNKKLADQLANSLPHILRWALALTIAARNGGLLKRCTGLLQHEHWIPDAQGIELNTHGIRDALITRGVSPEDASTFKEKLDSLGGSLSDCPVELLRWLTHGHIGFAAVWTGCAAILGRVDMPETTLDQIAYGYKDVKLRMGFDRWLSSCFAPGTEILEADIPRDLIEWLSA